MPNRIIKESICTSEDVDTMGWFVEVFYYRLIVSCDDYGRMDARPAILRAKLFPLRVEMALETVEEALDALEAIGCVRRYAVDGKPYLCLPAWADHQRVRNQRAKYPAPEGEGGDWPRAAADGGGARPEAEAESVSEGESEGEAEAEADVRAVAAAAAGMGMPFAKKDGEIARGLVAEYTEGWVLEAMARAADGPSRTWRYVRGILEGWKRGGGIDARRAAGAGVGKRVAAQLYPQRTYTAEEYAALVEVI